MSQQENPDRVSGGRDATLDDVRQLMGASTPHFALQLRSRIRDLIAELPRDHPARMEGEREIARLERIGMGAELRGEGAQEGQRPLPSAAAGA